MSGLMATAEESESSATAEDDAELQDKYTSLLSNAKQLCTRCEALSCEGASRLAKNCRAELSFLQRLSKKPIKISQLNSTNLYHLQGIVSAAERLPHVTAVLRRYHTPQLEYPVVVDVVCDRGRTWAKIVARNSKALTVDLNGQQEYGSKTIVTQAQEYSEAAQLNRHNFEPPRVLFLFCGDLLPQLSAALSHVGVQCQSLERVLGGEWVDETRTSAVTQHPASLTPASSQDMSSSCRRVNLDITTLIALVSNVCNGSCDIRFNDAILEQQAAEERSSPSLPVIQQFCQDKQLFVCETALRDFRAILDAVGGPTERQRAELLLANVSVVPNEPSARSLTLYLTSSVKERARVIFGTGDSLQAVTATANGGFVRAAAQAGVEFVAFLHPARALTERKEP